MSTPISSPPVLFIHGLWIHSSAWQPWIDRFAEHGFSASAPGWPGDSDTVEKTRENADALNDVGIEAICHHYADLIGTDEPLPIVIGHSFGGLIAQELLDNRFASAAVAIDPAPIKGVKALPFSQLKAGFPVLGNPANKKRTVSLTAKQFEYAFGNALPADESNALFERWTIPGPGRPLFEDATANFAKASPAAVNTATTIRGPLLLMSGSVDHTVPRKVTLEVAKLYSRNDLSRTDYVEFDGKGHSLTIDSGWGEVADRVLAWLAIQGFTGRARSATADGAS
ncbi:pimeloyl-ACP methyl ester carboxylesterase [Okibacterium sp. HSC-33S16]|uniref:alpha/beta hydrolase n=1 Tax=Okibacterium sp. HSC-33S16 TaxID=2910965 RepID=UPI00209DF1A9|nr:alpha/beta fold hydrolase [Okibacterium sp. HSC-33S16]MCP2030212.1 pimeloyl-ACP methyl ester carboxylesterase [Okibacterium sp. HSC-33S16]